MHGFSTFSKSPTRERKISNQVIKPKVDESIESMHIVTLDFYGGLKASLCHPNQASALDSEDPYPPVTATFDASMNNTHNRLNRIQHVQSTFPGQTSQSCDECSGCMMNIESVTSAARRQIVQGTTTICSCSGCQEPTYTQ